MDSLILHKHVTDLNKHLQKKLKLFKIIMLTRRLVPNARIVISLRPILRHFTNHVYLQRQITNDNIKETSLIKGSNTNGKLTPNFSKQKKPSLLGAKEPPKIAHKTDTRTWLE